MKIIFFWFWIILACVALLIILLFVMSGLHALEEARRAEASQIVSQMAKVCGTYFKEDGNTKRCVFQRIPVGDSPAVPPATCMPTHYFWYSVKDLGDSQVSFIGTRCNQGGKAPSVRNPYRRTLTVDYKCGTNFECAHWYTDYGK